jgi:hypothetical protein
MLQPFYIDNKYRVTVAFEILIKLVYEYNITQTDTHSLTETRLTVNKEIKITHKTPARLRNSVNMLNYTRSAVLKQEFPIVPA